MLLRKSYHFHAAHRNETLTDKCYNWHGHTYHIELTFVHERKPDNPHTGPLFSEYDAVLSNYFESFDHCLLINEHDPQYTKMSESFRGFTTKMRRFSYPTSLENLCFSIMHELLLMGMPVIEISMRETTSSTISYNLDDYHADVPVLIGEVDDGVHTCDTNHRGCCSVCGKTKFEQRMEKRSNVAATIEPADPGPEEE